MTEEKEKTEVRQAIKVLQHPKGVNFRPVHPNNQMIIHPDPPWTDWAKNGDTMSGKLICEFTDWPKADTEIKEEKEEEKEETGDGKDKVEEKDEVKSDQEKEEKEVTE